VKGYSEKDKRHMLRTRWRQLLSEDRGVNFWE